jgi:transcriptional regulator with XRE-family HTH domain
MLVGERIRQLREKRNWTQRELADRVQLNKSVMNRIELGTRPAEDHELKAFADIFDVSTDYILGRTDDSSEGLAFYGGPSEEVTEDEVEHLKESLEQYRKLKAKFLAGKEKGK